MAYEKGVMLAIKTSINIKLIKTIVLIIIGISIITISTISNAKYVFEVILKVADLDIDRTAPILNIKYSTEEYINGCVDVQIISNEPIKEVSGWQLLNDSKTLLKTYTSNIEEQIVVVDLSGNEAYVTINIKNIDTTAPQAELIEIVNTNTEYPQYANKDDVITAKIKIFDERLIQVDFNDFIVKIGTKENGYLKETKKIEENENHIIYEINLTNIESEGELIFEIPEESFEDLAGNKLKETILKTEIKIDNIPPIATYNQEILSNGKVMATINSNEILSQIEGWSYNENINSKQFISDIKYQRPVKDLAGNETTININVQATSFLGLESVASISKNGLSDIENYLVGNILEENKKYKFESIIFRTSENVPDDFLKIETFTNTYWGANAYTISGFFKVKYTYGYSGYKTMGNSELVTYLGKKYMHFGGEGTNYAGEKDINGNNPIPVEEAIQYKYGVSGIKMDLSDHSEYSIIYQIFFDDTGWLKPCYDGEETMKAIDEPLEALRFAVVPISERQYVLNKWQQDQGTNNIE